MPQNGNPGGDGCDTTLDERDWPRGQRWTKQHLDTRGVNRTEKSTY